MMSCRSTESHQNNNNVREKSFRIRHDDLKLFSRLLSRQETSNNHSSFRVYYGDVSVPFVWESQPGTPKHRFAADDGAALRPPLTPPPSYYSRAPSPAAEKKKVVPRSNLLRALLTKVSLRRAKSSVAAHAPSSPSPSFSLSPSFSSSSSSLSSFSATPSRRARRFSGSGSSFDKGIEDISSAESSGICCGIIINKERSISMKKVLFSIVGRRQS